jgi:hypothetical protein
MKPITSKQIRNFHIEVFPDDCDESPREWGSPTDIVSLADRVFSSDKNAIPLEMNEDGKLILNPCGLGNAKMYEYHSGGKALVLPIYMLSHSGVTISTTPFGDHWDSGCVGYIYMNNLSALKENFINPETGAIDWLKVKNVLEGDIKVYNQYLQGDVYFYKTYVTNPFDETKKESIDSCGGIYGLEEALKQAESEIPKLDSNYEFDLAEAS